MDRKRVCIVKCEAESVIKCVSIFGSKTDFTLIGDIDKTKALAEKMNVSLDQVELIDIIDDAEACRVGAELAVDKKIDIIMKGLVHTGTFMRSLIKRGRSLMVERHGIISLVSRFIIPGYHKPLYLTDCGINIDPDLAHKEGILRNAVNVVKSLGVSHPKVACISSVEVVNPKIKSTVEAEALSKKDIEGAIIEGPLSFDLAVSKAAAKIKGVDSAVSGDADILLFPHMDVGNAVYKSLSTFANARISGIAAGFILPVVLTSRADSTEVKLDSIQLALDMI